MKSSFISTKHHISALVLILFIGHVPIKANSQTDSIQAYLNCYQYTKALSLIKNSINTTENPRQLYILMGNAYRGLYQFSEAIEAYKKVLEQDTTDVRILIEIANTYKQLPDNKSAILYYLKALDHDSLNVAFRFEIANCKFSIDQYLEAMDDYRYLYRNDSLNLYLLKRMAMCYYKISQIDSSILFYYKILKINLDDPTSILNLCNLLLLKKEYKEGIRITEAFRFFDTTNRSINSMRAYFYLLNESYRESVNIFKECLESNDTSRFVYKNIGIAYFRVEGYDTAKYFLEKAYYMDTTDITNLHFLGLACSKSFYKKLGIEYLEKAMALYNPTIEKIANLYLNTSEACDAWGNCPATKKIEVNQKAIYYNPVEYNLLYKLASVYDNKLNDEPNALKYYNRYLNVIPEEKKKEEQFIYDYVMKRVSKLKGE